jgi:hypothetical protein
VLGVATRDVAVAALVAAGLWAAVGAALLAQ